MVLFPLKRVNKSFAFFIKILVLFTNKLLVFFVGVLIYITAFALKFYVMFIGSSNCGAFCTFGSSWFEAFNMMLGNYEPDNIFGVVPSNYNFTETVIYNSSTTVTYGSIFLEQFTDVFFDPISYAIFIL